MTYVRVPGAISAFTRVFDALWRHEVTRCRPGTQLASIDNRGQRKRHHSREAHAPPSFAGPSSQQPRGAERRQALGCSGTRRRANDAGPQAPLGALRPMTRDVRLSALHRGGCWPGPARDEASKASPSASSSRPLVMAEGGVPEPPGSVVTSHARRTPHPAPLSARLRKTPSVNGTGIGI